MILIMIIHLCALSKILSRYKDMHIYFFTSNQKARTWMCIKMSVCSKRMVYIPNYVNLIRTLVLLYLTNYEILANFLTIYQPILINISMKANSIKTQFLYKIKYDFKGYIRSLLCFKSFRSSVPIKYLTYVLMFIEKT